MKSPPSIFTDLETQFLQWKTNLWLVPTPYTEFTELINNVDQLLPVPEKIVEIQYHLDNLLRFIDRHLSHANWNNRVW